MAIPIGRQGKVFLKQEASYGVEEALTAAEAMRHTEVAFTWDPFARTTSPEKKMSPGPVNRFDRKQAAALGSLVGLLRPGGALNTLAECDQVLDAAFGARTNVTLDTTVSASPSPTTTGCDVASAGALAVGDAVLITVTGQAKSPFVRFLATVSGNTLTWAPALPAAPTAGDALKGGITYKLTTDLAKSLTIAHYLPGFDRELLGAAIDSMTLTFDPNEEPRFTGAGPAASQTTTVQAEPGSFTRVGGNPPSGLVGDLYIGDTAYLFKTLEIAITNGLVVRNQEYGVNAPTEVYRNARREITVALEAFAETEATLYDLAEAGTNVGLMKQTGRTEGNIVAVHAPLVEFKVPEQDDPDQEVNWSFSGMALESADTVNDELRFAFM